MSDQKDIGTGEPEPRCRNAKVHHWLARTFGGVGYIEEKVCNNCGVVAHRTPPLIQKGEVIKSFGYRYSFN